LVELGKEYGFEARALPLMGDAAGAFSSSRVRVLVQNAELSAAWKILGRPHALTGTVVAGDKRGRSIGFPTANLDGVVELLPPHGVYVCVVDAVGAATNALAHGVANIGVRPTVGAGFSVEVHLLDFAGDLYGKQLRVHLLERLRGEQKFADVAALTAQIALDADAARSAAAAAYPEPPKSGGFF
jgi:riboflavin kinase/FMN adenylyltransferase